MLLLYAVTLVRAVITGNKLRANGQLFFKFILYLTLFLTIISRFLVIPLYVIIPYSRFRPNFKTGVIIILKVSKKV